MKVRKDKFWGLERRKFPRFKDNIFIFGNLRSRSTEEFKTLTEDISAGGLMFETERDIPAQSELELQIYQPINSHKRMIFSISVLAKVIWIGKIEKENIEEGENKYKVGVEFTEIKGEDRQRIIKYVENKL